MNDVMGLVEVTKMMSGTMMTMSKMTNDHYDLVHHMLSLVARGLVGRTTMMLNTKNSFHS